eukprot:g6469.t1
MRAPIEDVLRKSNQAKFLLNKNPKPHKKARISTHTAAIILKAASMSMNKGKEADSRVLADEAKPFLEMAARNKENKVDDRSQDSDNDGVNNHIDADADGDGKVDTGKKDTDSDGVADFADADADGDGKTDADKVDTNKDGIDDRQQDSDNDGV